MLNLNNVNEKAIAFLNRTDKTEKMTLDWKTINIQGEWKVRDLWAHAEKGKYKDSYTVEVQPHEAIIIKLSK